MKDRYLCICASTFCIYRTRSQQIEILVKALNTVVTWWDDTKSRHHILIKITAIKSKCSHLNNDVLLKGRQYLKRNQKHILVYRYKYRTWILWLAHLLQNSRSGHAYLFSTKILTTTFQRITLNFIQFQRTNYTHLTSKIFHSRILYWFKKIIFIQQPFVHSRIIYWFNTYIIFLHMVCAAASTSFHIKAY